MLYFKNNIFFGAKEVYLVILFGILSAFYIENLAHISVGKYVSYVLFIGIIITYFINRLSGINLIIFISIISPQFSRDLVQEVIDSKNNSIEAFYTLHSVSLFGFSLLVLCLLILAFISFVNILKNNYVTKPFGKILILILVSLIYLLVGAFLGLFFDVETSSRAIFSDLQLPILFLCALLVAQDLLLKYAPEFLFKSLAKSIFIAVLIVGFRAIVLAVSDFTLSNFHFDFSTQPYFAYPIFFAIIMSKYPQRGRIFFLVISLIAAFSIKRADLLFAFACILITYFSFFSTRSFREFNSAFKGGIYILTGSLGLLYSVSLFDDRLLAFLLYKLQFFTTEIWSTENLSNSASIRQLEFINIINVAQEKIYPFIIGQGAGGSFNFDYTGGINLGVSDYSSDEISSNTFYRPHTFVNYIFLKGGIILLIAYVSLVIFAFRSTLKAIRFLGKEGCNNLLVFCCWFFLFYTVFSLNMFWRPMVAFMFFLILMVLLAFKKNGQF